MEGLLIKKPRFEGIKFHQIASGRSKFARFNTTQYVTRFGIENLGEDPEYELGVLLKQLIDQAYGNATLEFGREPTMYNVLIDGEILNQPVYITIHERVEGLEIEMVCFSSNSPKNIFIDNE
jgi:hypothetical protein